tara:strand:+ start:567 stop:791 length:225 start_codon:yes stop_codon:yes gene_type:complete
MGKSDRKRLLENKKKKRENEGVEVFTILLMALTFYSEDVNYEGKNSPIKLDKGHKARQALQTMEKYYRSGRKIL